MKTPGVRDARKAGQAVGDGRTIELVAGLALHHRLHQLVVQQPGGALAHAQGALQGQGQEPCLGLADEV
jgi:hypothetical protein